MNKQQLQPRILKTAVIKEELVTLTGNWRKALILNQFIYWSQHRGSQIDTQRFWEEERLRNELDLQSFEHGWIYKKASELIDELMLDITPVTIRQDIQALVEMGLLDQRPNPDDRLDRTLQYRPNIMNIQYALQCLGYSLDRYPLLLDEHGSFIPRLENKGKLPYVPLDQRKDYANHGYVYIVQSANHFKIGKSNNVPRRMCEFGLQLPEAFTLVHTIQTTNMHSAEHELHERYQHCRTNGEWFALMPGDVDAICMITTMEY